MRNINPVPPVIRPKPVKINKIIEKKRLPLTSYTEHKFFGSIWVIKSSFKPRKLRRR